MVGNAHPTNSVWVVGVPEDDYRALQNLLAADPEIGDLIPSGGGVRKIRFALPGRGKRGGGRLIYYWHISGETVYLLLAYRKGRQENLVQDELAVLRRLAKELEHATRP